MVIDHLIDKPVSGFIDGFECADVLEKQFKEIFIIFGFIGEYPTSIAVVDRKGHAATALDTHYGLIFCKVLGQSVFAYTTSVHSSTTSHRGVQDRTV